MKSNRIFLFAVLGLFLLRPTVSGAAAPDYKQVISGVPRSEALSRCVRGWGAIGKTDSRLQVLERFERAAPEGIRILLEVGNSGFPRYEYVMISGGTVNTSTRHDISLRGTDLGRLVSKEASSSFHDMRDEIRESVSDGDCLFLTARTAVVDRTVVFYGGSDQINYPLLRAMVRFLENTTGGKTKAN